MSGANAKAMWNELRAKILRRIEEIDKITPWQEVEPAWWLHMQEVQRAAFKGREYRHARTQEPTPMTALLSDLAVCVGWCIRLPFRLKDKLT